MARNIFRQCGKKTMFGLEKESKVNSKVRRHGRRQARQFLKRQVETELTEMEQEKKEAVETDRYIELEAEYMEMVRRDEEDWRWEEVPLYGY